jgi:hypothetical protein
MRKDHIVCWILALLASLSFNTALSAQEPNCDEIRAMAEMVKARSTSTLTEWSRKAGDSYRAKVVFAFRLFELHPTDHHAALAILDLIPQNDEQDYVWHTFGAYIECDAGAKNVTETDKDIPILAGLGGRLLRDLARAIILEPDKMFAYISYAHISLADPNSYYAVEMQRVCRDRHREFIKAVERLTPTEKELFVKHILNPNGCHVLAFPEQ